MSSHSRLNDVVTRLSAAVDEHGWDEVLDALSAVVADRGEPSSRSGPLAPALSAAHACARSPWAPVVAPLLAGFMATARPGLKETTAGDEPYSDDLLILPRDQLSGPLARARQRRFVAMVSSAQAAGLLVATSAHQPSVRAFATGMMAPGVGYLATADPTRAALTVLVFAASLLLWFGTGNMALPGLIWVGAAGLAARRARTRGLRWPATAVLVGGATAATAVAIRRRRRQMLQEQTAAAQAANEFLRVADRPLQDQRVVAADDELDDEQLALTRRFVDMALQEHDDWTGWNVIDQFQPAALRYQINAVQDALAMQRFTRTPAFSGYLHEAHTRLFDRYLHKKVWGYWAWENLWGNLEWDPDPAKRQNIMMTGYLMQSLGLYQVVSGDLRHSEPGALTFRWNDRRAYPYDFGRLSGQLAADYLRSPWGLVTCEPNWIFALCNMRGATGLRLHDQVHGTDYWQRIASRYRQGFQRELVGADGALMGHRSSRVGFGGPGPGLTTDLRPLVPNVADRGHLLLSAVCREADGAVRTPFASDDRLLDAGNYTYHPLAAYAMVIESAREAGDEELAKGVETELRGRTRVEVDDRGWLRFDGASVLAHAGYARAAWGKEGAWLDLVERGRPEHWRSSPYLEEVPYPTVMVTRAVSTDGGGLDFSLRLNGSGASVTVAGLTPRRSYAVEGAARPSLTADHHGRARLDITERGRARVAITPTREESR